MMNPQPSPCFIIKALFRVICICMLSLCMSGDAFRKKEPMLFFSSIFSSSLSASFLSSLSRLQGSRPSKLYGFSEQQMALQPFNPFTSRNRNINKHWFDSDSLEAFYTFISNQPLLSAKQEYQLGRAIQFWNRLENVRASLCERLRAKNVSAISDSDLAIYIGCNPEEIGKMRKYYELSKRRLLLSNLKLVLAVVSRYRTSLISNSELITQGTLGLSQAVTRYDYTRGFRFATYATWYIHQAISDYVRDRKANIELPNRQLVLLRRVKQFMSKIAEKSGRNPSIGEIAEALAVPRFEVMKVLSRRQTATRLDDPIVGTSTDKDGDRVRTFEMTLSSLTAEPMESLAVEAIKSQVESLLQGNMTQTEKNILRMRLGLDDGREMPLKEVGKKYKVSWLKVQKLEEAALGKLRSMDLDPDTTMRMLSHQQSLNTFP